MSKELTVLEKLDLIYSFALMMCNEDNEPLLTEYKNEIETALKEKEKKIIGTTTVDKALEKCLLDNCPDVAKKLKALEIIKEKRVDIPLLISYIKEKPNDEWALCSYNSMCEDRIKCIYYEGRDYLKPLPLIQEEFDLLKEVLL